MDKMKLWMCPECWHEVYCDWRQPKDLTWSDGHVCTFKSPQDMSTVDVTSWDDLLAGLAAPKIPEEEVEKVHSALRIAYDDEIRMMLRYALKAERPKVILHPFRVSGSQHIAEFEVKDLNLEDNPQKINFHMQNTSQWLYAGCILYDERDHRVSRHH